MALALAWIAMPMPMPIQNISIHANANAKTHTQATNIPEFDNDNRTQENRTAASGCKQASNKPTEPLSLSLSGNRKKNNPDSSFG